MYRNNDVTVKWLLNDKYQAEAIVDVLLTVPVAKLIL